MNPEIRTDLKSRDLNFSAGLKKACAQAKGSL